MKNTCHEKSVATADRHKYEGIRLLTFLVRNVCVARIRPQPCFLWNWWDMSYEAPISKSTKTRVIMSLRDEENMVGLDWIAAVYFSFSYNLIRLENSISLNFLLPQIKGVIVKLHLTDWFLWSLHSAHKPFQLIFRSDETFWIRFFRGSYCQQKSLFCS